MFERNEVNHGWNYFVAIEENLSKLSRYVELSTENYKVFSIEMVSLLLAASSEVDVVLKNICGIIDSDKEAKNIVGYREIVLSKFPDCYNEIISIPRFGLMFKPWSEWQNLEPLPWWQSYNKVKHHRSESYTLANLENVLNAMAGLFSANLMFSKLVGVGQLTPPNLLYRAVNTPAFVSSTFSGEPALIIN
ncbi:MAG: hypothetical protein MI794_13725 [Pseudomonadales bacterium]|nr:hypothetical protein [Pseudomonadales bacterium]